MVGRAEIVLTAEILRCAQDDKRISSGGLNLADMGRSVLRPYSCPFAPS